MKTIRELIQFENEMVEMYKQGILRSPIHLSGSEDLDLEEFLIDYFKDNVKKDDWIFTTYRSHYHSLLKGVSEDWLKNWIKKGYSIHVMNKEHRVFTSAIVGGHLSVALGVAKAIKLKGGKEKVHVFCGDMTSESGTFWEVWKYAYFNKLPIHFVIEDNGLSTDTPTQEVWGKNTCWWRDKDWAHNITYFQYKRHYPHYGCGVWVDFKDEKNKIKQQDLEEYKYDCLCTAEFWWANKKDWPLGTMIIFNDPGNVKIYVPKSGSIASNGYFNSDCKRCEKLRKELNKYEND